MKYGFRNNVIVLTISLSVALLPFRAMAGNAETTALSPLPVVGAGTAMFQSLFQQS